MYSVYTSLVLHYVFLQFQIRVSGANKELSFFDYGALHFFSEETSACATTIIREKMNSETYMNFNYRSFKLIFFFDSRSVAKLLLLYHKKPPNKHKFL